MADVKISELGSAVTIADSNYLVVDTGSATLKATGALVKEYIIGDNDISGLGDGSATGAIDAVNDKIEDNVIPTMTQNGAHNLYGGKHTTATDNGVIWTANADGTITISGTVGSGRTYSSSVGSHFILKAGTYVLCTNLVPGSSGTKHTNMELINATSLTHILKLENAETGTFTLASDTECYLILVCNKTGESYSGTFKPMIKLSTDTDPTYAPYAMTNRELTENKAPYLSSSSVGTNISQSVSAGDTYTAPYDGIYLISCKNSGSSGTATINVNSVPIAMNDKPDMEYVSVPLKKGTVLQMRSNGSGTNYAYYIWSYFMA